MSWLGGRRWFVHGAGTLNRTGHGAPSTIGPMIDSTAHEPASEPRTGRPVKVYVEVTDTLSISYTTGIQRVVREVVSRLSGPEYPDIELVPLFRPAPQVDYRRLTESEKQALESHPAGGAAGRRADKFGPLAPLVRLVGDTRAVYEFRLKYRHLNAVARERRANNSDLTINGMEPGSIFLDIEGSWFDPEPRSSLLPKLRSAGVECIVMVHDVMPSLFPEWFDERQVDVFDQWLEAHIMNSRRFLTNSRCTMADLKAIAQRSGIDLDDRVRPITLGADFATVAPVEVPLDDPASKYILVVGTIEPRKNHRLVLDAWEILRRSHPDLGLVFVGKEGWMVDDFVASIRGHEEFGRRFRWLGGLLDSELLWLYSNAFVTVAPSLYEGLGVPVIEALKAGCPTIASTGGALPEAGEGFTELVDPHDVPSLVSVIERHLDDPSYHQARRELARSYLPPSWETTASEVAEAIRDVAESIGADN